MPTVFTSELPNEEEEVSTPGIKSVSNTFSITILITISFYV